MCAMSVTTKLIIQEACLLKWFDPESIDVLKWLNSFEYLMDIMRIANDEKVEFLLKYIKPSALKCLESTVSPVNLRNLSYDELVSKLEISFSHFKGEWAGNLRFFYRDQFVGESVPQYVLALRKIASKGSHFIRHNSNLMKRFIKGLRDEEMKLLLLDKQDLTFAKAVALAQQMELYKISTQMN